MPNRTASPIGSASPQSTAQALAAIMSQSGNRAHNQATKFAQLTLDVCRGLETNLALMLEANEDHWSNEHSEPYVEPSLNQYELHGLSRMVIASLNLLAAAAEQQLHDMKQRVQERA